MNYYKRIVLDFDDTLAFHEDRNFKDATPNKKLIEKTNALFYQGWQIDIFTARGSISCSSREEARLKYESEIVSWLDKHGVKYNILSFDKPLAVYYIDDKSITPDDFINIDIQQIEGGLSGANIYSDGKYVHKQDVNAHLTKHWFNTANSFNIKTPIIYRIIGETITMDYIHQDSDYFENRFYVALGLIQEALTKMKSIPVDDELDFTMYRNRILEHAKNSGKEEFVSLAKRLNEFGLIRSFSHGDFAIKNMLFKENDLYLIDPITNVFGCTELDVAKFCASLIVNKYSNKIINDSISQLKSYLTSIDIDTLKLLISSEIIRIFKYHPDKNFIVKCVNHVNEFK